MGIAVEGRRMSTQSLRYLHLHRVLTHYTYRPSLRSHPTTQDSTPGDEKSTQKVEVYHRSTLDTTPPGRYASELVRNNIISRNGTGIHANFASCHTKYNVSSHLG